MEPFPSPVFTAMFRFGAVPGLMETQPLSLLPSFQTGASDVFKAPSDREVLRHAWLCGRPQGSTPEALTLG